MPAAYASTSELTAWLPAGVVVADATRLLARATEVVDGHVTAAFAVSTSTDLPTDSRVAAALRDATCAQVEFWLEVGEDHDVAGMAGRQVSIGHLSMAALPPELAPRARRILAGAGLLSTAGQPSWAGA